MGAANNNVTGVAPGTVGYALVSGGASANPSYAILGVPGGGTGLATLTAYALMAGGTTSTGNMQQVSGLGSAGQVLTSAGAGALPTWSAVPANAFPWTVVTGASQALAVNHGYVSADVTDPVVYTLPVSSSVGAIIRVTGIATGNGWEVDQAADQYIQLGSSSTSVGAAGVLSSTDANDTVELLCVEADLGWVVLSSIGNLNLV